VSTENDVTEHLHVRESTVVFRSVIGKREVSGSEKHDLHAEIEAEQRQYVATSFVAKAKAEGIRRALLAQGICASRFPTIDFKIKTDHYCKRTIYTNDTWIYAL
jgi:hypothetical protein